MADLVRWDPFGEMLSLRQVVDRLFEDAWVRPARILTGEAAGFLPVDLCETANDLVLTASVPGVKPEDIDITIQGDMLTIRGEMKREESITDGKYHRQERQYGGFTRHISLPTGVSSEQAEAHFENGVLTLRLPKAEQARQRKIQVQAAKPG